MRSKLLSVMVLLVVIASLLVGCAAPTQAPAESSTQQSEQAADNSAATQAPAETGTDPVTLKVWIGWGDNPAQLQSLFDRFGEEYGVKVEVNANVPLDKIIPALSGNEPPDVLIYGWPDVVSTWSREGLIKPLNQVITDNAIDMDDIIPATLSYCQLGDEYYCLPWGTDLSVLYWNKTLFEEAGLDPETPPASWEELSAMAEKLTIIEDGEIQQLGFISDYPWTHSDILLALNGGSWYSEDGKTVTINTPEMIETLNFQQQFYKKYGTEEVLKFIASGGQYASPDQAFYAGKLAMYIDGEWQPSPNFIQKYKPELDFGIAPVPAPEAKSEFANSVTLAGSVVVIPTETKNPELAGKMLAWLMRGDIIAEQMYNNFNIPTSKSAFADPRFSENEYLSLMCDLAASPNARPLDFGPVAGDMSAKLAEVEEKVLHFEQDPAPLLEEAQIYLQEKLDQALGQ